MPSCHKYIRCECCGATMRADVIKRHLKVCVAPKSECRKKLKKVPHEYFFPSLEVPHLYRMDTAIDMKKLNQPLSPVAPDYTAKYPNGEPMWIEMVLSNGVSYWIETNWGEL